MAGLTGAVCSVRIGVYLLFLCSGGVIPLRKGHSRRKVSAIIRFFIWLCVLVIVLFVGYYLVAIKDYSHLLDDPSAPLRSFVAANPTTASSVEATYDPSA